MAHNKESGNQARSKAMNSANANTVPKKGTPMIVERVNRIPMINFAVTMGFSQYDKLKSSYVTVGDVMTRAETWAAFLWQKVQPYVEKLQDPINKADQLACHTIDFVEEKLNAIKVSKSLDTIVTKYKQVSAPPNSASASQ